MDDVSHSPQRCATPVVVFSFNRAELTRAVLEVVASVRPPVLFLFCDGPREGHPTDAERCAAVHRELADVDWDCEVRRILHTENLGIERSIETGLDLVFSEVDRAIVLEDDCVPDPSFFPFCDELLERYRDRPDIGGVAGLALDTPRKLFGGASYAFAPVGPGWGWATWGDRWQRHRRDFPRNADNRVVPASPTPPRAADLRATTFSAGMRRYVLDGYRTATTTDGFPWDFVLGMSTVLTGRRVIVPATNMIKNIGFGVDGTHYTEFKSMPAADATTFPLVHPADDRLDPRIGRELEFDFLWFPVGRRRELRNRIAPGLVRTALLRLFNSAAAVGGRAGLWRLRAGLIAALRRRGPAPAPAAAVEPAGQERSLTG